MLTFASVGGAAARFPTIHKGPLMFDPGKAKKKRQASGGDYQVCDKQQS